MAYSFNDLFHGLRISMRINGIAVGLTPGLLCLLAPARLFSAAAVGEVTWPLRLAGALLVAFGLSQLLHAATRLIETPVLWTSIFTNGLISVTLLVAYVRGDFGMLGIVGRLVLILIVGLALVGAVLPLRYLRTGYNA